MVYGVGGMGRSLSKNHDLIDILSFFSSFHLISGRVLSFSIIFQHIFESFCPFCGVFPPLPLRVLAGGESRGMGRVFPRRSWGVYICLKHKLTQGWIFWVTWFSAKFGPARDQPGNRPPCPGSIINQCPYFLLKQITNMLIGSIPKLTFPYLAPEEGRGGVVTNLCQTYLVGMKAT